MALETSPADLYCYVGKDIHNFEVECSVSRPADADVQVAIKSQIANKR